ncbi:MAG: hypothetical protein MUF72_21375 [Elainella sp. Prado103]|nr:hypothetical protein [Elainella sp. Prado103]
MEVDPPAKQSNQPSTVQQSEDKLPRNLWIEIISVLTIGYLIFSLIIPMFLKPERPLPRKIETPDIILIALVLLFNSGLLNRLEDFGISQDSGVTARFRQLKQEVNDQKRQIDELQAQQLQQLEEQQKNLEEMQAFMYNFLLGEKDYEKIRQLYQHAQAKTRYEFYVSGRVGDELRRLRDFGLVKTKSGYISDVVRASDAGNHAIDLTQYLDVTDLGRKFLATRETLESNL